MQTESVSRVEMFAGVDRVAVVASDTRSHFASSGSRLADQLAAHLSAFNAASDLVPFFGDYRLAHTEADYQLRDSVCLAFHGFYSQAFSTLRSVCELVLLQSSLPEGAISSETEVNLVWITGQRARQRSEKKATSLETWAVNGARIPKWQEMLQRLLNSNTARRFNEETRLGDRLKEFFERLNSYVHERGFLRSATGLSSGNFLRFSEKSISLFVTNLMHATQLSVSMLLLAFLPTATSEKDAAAGSIDNGQLAMVLRILPQKDANFFRIIRDGEGVTI